MFIKETLEQDSFHLSNRKQQSNFNDLQCTIQDGFFDICDLELINTTWWFNRHHFLTLYPKHLQSWHPFL